jgi:hypothetical protein
MQELSRTAYQSWSTSKHILLGLALSMRSIKPSVV